jgi:type II secretory pathway pseudopilin PulG
MRSRSAGATLLEAMVALALLAGAGTSLLAALSASIRSDTELQRREAALRSAHRVLTAMSLLTRDELDQRIGRHPVGEFIAEVQRPEPTLYRLSIAEARAPGVEALMTVVYRPDGTRERRNGGTRE